ncbi:LuxR C-terminal-related transcriptional regulator [Paenibacillus sp. A14]|uniref:LuxR C-terminal-related transcriptional regulator n=1 Tax=Paenibacillus sp. A14 TaxID=3119820 RepID=UPI002FE009C2
MIERKDVKSIGDILHRVQEHGFVGRAREQETFQRYLINMGQRNERILNVYGPPGIGKTELLGQFKRQAESMGFRQVLLDFREIGPGDGETGLWCLHESAASGPLLVVLDHYEEAGPLDKWVRTSLIPRLPVDTFILIGSRYPLLRSWISSPAWISMIVSMTLSELSRDEAEEYMKRSGITRMTDLDQAWLHTKGHPLMLSLWSGKMSRILDSAEEVGTPRLEPLLDCLLDYGLEESHRQELTDVLEVAAFLRHFDRERLEALLRRSLPSTAFDRLIQLSFVRKYSRGWQINRLIREALRNRVKARTPERYEQLRNATVNYYTSRLQQKLVQAHDVTEEVEELMQYLGNPVLRAHYRHVEGIHYVLEQPDPGNLEEAKAYIRQRQINARPCRIICADPETGEEYRYRLTREESLLRFNPAQPILLVESYPDTVKLFRNHDGELFGLAAVVPVNREHISLLASSPVSRAYIESLASEELAEIQQLSGPDCHKGYFLLAMDMENLEDDHQRSILVHFTLKYLLSGERLFVSPPPHPYFQDAYRNLGFEVIPGTDHTYYDSETKAFTFVADSRGSGLFQLFEKWMTRPLPRPDSSVPSSDAGELTLFTAREREVADKLLRGMTNQQISQALYISEAAVKKHLTAMMRKACVQNRTQLVSAMLRDLPDSK